MKKLMSLLLVMIMLLSFAACSGNGGGQTQAPSKLQNVLDVEALIDAIGEVTIKSLDAIDKAEKEYGYLSAEEQALVSNHNKLLRARDQYSDEINNAIVGKWEFVKGHIVNPGVKMLEIYKGGIAKCADSINYYNLTWELVDDIITIKGSNAFSIYAFTLEDNNGTLELHSTDGESIISKTAE